MKRRLLSKRILSFFLALVLSAALACPISAKTGKDTADEIISGILSFKKTQCGARSDQAFIDTYLTDNAGALSEWYILSLSQLEKADFSSYERALLRFLDENEVSSATTREKYALALIACGSQNSYITRTLDDATGRLGLMSWVFSLHILNNGFSTEMIRAENVLRTILNFQKSDGGWAVIGEKGDVDVTAMTIQALSPYYGSDSAVTTAVDRGISLLSSRQLSSGGFKTMGKENVESSAQVVIALSCLGIDCRNDARFRKNGSSVFDALLSYRLSDGSFSHLPGGTFNELATVETLFSMTAYRLMCDHKGSIYLFDREDDTSSEKANTTQRNKSASKKTKHASSSVKSKSSSSKKMVTSSNSNNHSSGANSTPPRDADPQQPIQNHQSDSKASQETTKPASSKTKPTASEAAATETTASGAVKVEKENDSATEETVYSTPSQLAPKQKNAPGVSYKLWASLIAVVLAAGGCLLLWRLKKRSYKNFIAVGVAMVAVILFIWLTDFSTKEKYYQTEPKENAIGSVTLSIRCDTILDKNPPSFVPKDGVILEETRFEIEKDDTVADVLDDAAKAFSLVIDSTPSTSTYIRSINNIGEFDFGELSGWMYFVDGDAPSVGCSEYRLEGGEHIEWNYTCSLGEDLGVHYDEEN